MGSKAIFEAASDMAEYLAATRKVLLYPTDGPTSESDRLCGRSTFCSAHENGSLNKLMVVVVPRATDKDATETPEEVRCQMNARPVVI